MANNYWWNKYYKRCNSTKEEYEDEWGFEKGEPIQDGYEPTFEDFVEVKSKYYKYLGEGELGVCILGQDNKLYFTYGHYLEEITEKRILEIIKGS